MRTGLPSLLFVVFLVLKLTKVITWSWWWVSAPLWIAFSFYTACILVVVFWTIASGKQVTFKRQSGKW